MLNVLFFYLSGHLWQLSLQRNFTLQLLLVIYSSHLVHFFPYIIWTLHSSLCCKQFSTAVARHGFKYYDCCWTALTCLPIYPQAMYVKIGCSIMWTVEAFLLRVVSMVNNPSPTDMASNPPWKFSCLVRCNPLAPSLNKEIIHLKKKSLKAKIKENKRYDCFPYTKKYQEAKIFQEWILSQFTKVQLFKKINTIY